MPEIRISIPDSKDNSKEIVGAIEKRTRLLEKTLSKLSSSKNDGVSKVLDIIKKNKAEEHKSMSKMMSAFSSVVSKLKPQKIVMEKSDDKSITSSINKRFSLLEDLIRKNKNIKTIVKNIVQVPKENNKKVDNIERNVNIIVQSFKKKGTSVIPSPS